MSKINKLILIHMNYYIHMNENQNKNPRNTRKEMDSEMRYYLFYSYHLSLRWDVFLAFLIISY